MQVKSHGNGCSLLYGTAVDQQSIHGHHLADIVSWQVWHLLQLRSVQQGMLGHLRVTLAASQAKLSRRLLTESPPCLMQMEGYGVNST